MSAGVSVGRVAALCFGEQPGSVWGAQAARKEERMPMRNTRIASFESRNLRRVFDSACVILREVFFMEVSL